MNDKPKELVIHNRAPDGEFMCVYGTEETKPIDLELERIAPKPPIFPKMEKLTLLDYAIIGFIGAFIIAWDLLKVIAVFIAIVVTVGVIAVGLSYLTGYWRP